MSAALRPVAGEEGLMVSIQFGDSILADVEQLIGALPDDAVASPLRSTVPLVAFWRMPGPRVSQLSATIGVDCAPPIALCFEFPVPVQRGRGKPSFTDLMIVAASSAVAVEAKFREPPYETVRAWLRSPAEANRVEVLEGWLDLIRAATGVEVTAAEVAELPYQLIHRTASVCSIPREVRAVVYQVFGNAPHDYYVDILSDLAGRIGRPPRLGFHVLSCPMECHQSHADLVQQWKQGARLVGEAVRRELLSESLFSFGEPVHHAART